MHSNRSMLHRFAAWLRSSGGLFLLLPWAFPLGAQAPDKVLWLLLDLPPYAVLVDGKPTNGVFDVKLNLILKNWPEAKHEFLAANTARIKTIIEKDDQKACFALSLITPAHESRFYTAATGPVSPHSLIVRDEAAAKIPVNSKGQVQVLNLINNPELRGVVNAGRSYSAFIDAQMGQRGAKSGLQNVASTQGNSNLLKMVALGRADYTIEYEELWFFQKSRDESLKNLHLKVMPIEGVSLLSGGFSCPRTAWGRETIIKIRSIVSRLAMKPEFQNRVNQWQSPETIQSYKVDIDKFYDNLAAPVDPSKIPAAPKGPLPPWEGPI